MVIMNMYIISEPVFRNTQWYKEIISGIENSERKKALSPVFIDYGTFSDMIPKIKSDTNTLLVLGTSDAWTSKVLEAVYEAKIYPVLINAGNISFPSPHTVITQSYYQSAFLLYNFLRGMGCEKTAFFGMNYDSGSDLKKLSGFKAAGGDTDCVFVNDGSVTAMTENFLKRKNEFDSIICTNDYVAASLIKKLDAKEIPYKIASFGKTIMLGRLYEDIIRVTLDFYEAGLKTADLYEWIAKNNTVISITVTVKNKVFTKGGELTISECGKYIPAFGNSKFDFYADSEIKKADLLEKLLNNAEDLDINILEALFCGETYEKTAEICNIGVTTVKYRLNRLKKILGLINNRELIEIFKF